jgi:hypothetical protein
MTLARYAPPDVPSGDASGGSPASKSSLEDCSFGTLVSCMGGCSFGLETLLDGHQGMRDAGYMDLKNWYQRDEWPLAYRMCVESWMTSGGIFRNLRRLHLVLETSIEVSKGLLPVLEDLNIRFYSCHAFRALRVDSPSLRKLVLSALSKNHGMLSLRAWPHVVAQWKAVRRTRVAYLPCA